MNIPNTEPCQFSAGLTISFQRSFPQYSYDDGFQAAHYTINGASGSKQIDGNYANGVWTFTLTAKLNDLVAGMYQLFGWVESGSGDDVIKYPVYSGSLQVNAALTTASNVDLRSQLQQQYDNINTAITAYVVNPVEEIMISGRTYRRPTLIALYKFRALTWKSLRTERKRERMRNGLPVHSSIKVRLTAG